MKESKDEASAETLLGLLMWCTRALQLVWTACWILC